jgi:hypothetical protein
MLKHRFSALMIFHDAETPFISPCSTVHFSDAETLCSTVHFSDAETPLKNTGDCFPDAETPLFGTFHFFPVTETSHSPIILTPETTPSSTCFAFSPFLCCNTIRSNLSFSPVAETPIVSNFSSSSPDAETPLFSIFHPLPIIFLTLHHRRNNSVQQLFRLFVAETPFASNPSSFIHVAETPFASNLHHSSMMLKHHRSAPSDFLPILKHQLSAVLHL